uniref:Mitotic checkpoint serine/threonine-protein kinase BUB1 n=1 Tax=Cacopsylla melanoneura TaxID=428564 RepID=A0A8D8V6Q8_9HEMI
MNYTVNTKEAMKLVQDMWSSPSPSKGTCSQPDDLTFKKPVSIKKPVVARSPRSAAAAPAPAAPFKIFMEETTCTDTNVNKPPASTATPISMPRFEIFTDEDSNEDEHPVPAVVAPKTPKFDIYADEDSDEAAAALSSKKSASVQKVPPKTPKFDIYEDDTPAPPKSQAKNAVAPAPKTPKFDIYTDDETGEPEVKEGPVAGQLSCTERPRSNGVNIRALPFNSVYDQVIPEEEELLARPLTDEMPLQHQPMVLPFRAPAHDLDAQPLGSECKENCPPGHSASSCGSTSSGTGRRLNGYLVPSNVSIPTEEELLEADDELADDLTCNTRAFNFVLPSSTPFINMRSKSGSVGYSGGSCDGSFLQDSAPPGNLSYKNQCDTQNLSIILEASKEKSSSSSGSSGCLGGLNSCEKNPLVPPHIVHPIYKYNACAVGAGSSGLEESVADLYLNQIDPFDEKLIDELLSQKVQFPLARHRVGYECFFSELNGLKVNSHANFGSTEYTILKELGKGAYARVLMGKMSSNGAPGNGVDGDLVALKQQRPACVWEWYISKEVEYRLKPSSPLLHYFVLPHHIYVFKNSSVLASPWAKFGNLLDLVNVVKVKTGKSLKLQACLKLSVDMCRAIQALHKINIIHGDIKPDNFVVCNFLRSDLPCLKLIDFGRSIDMSLFPQGTTFNTVVTTDGFQCTEMKEGREWSYHTDVYGLAGSICCVLLGKYMNTMKKGTDWCLTDTIPRYMGRSTMEPIFDKLLNLPQEYDTNILQQVIAQLEQTLELSLMNSDEGLLAVDEILTQL